jgi:glucokinase
VPTNNSQGGSGNSLGPVVCVDFGGSAIRTCVESDGAFLAARVAEIAAGKELETVAELVTQMLDETGLVPAAISVAVPGVVDFSTQSLLRAHEKYRSLDGVNLKDWFHRKWNLPFALENDARSALLGEVTSGVAAGARNAVMVILGTGIGTAALVDGNIMRGHSGHGGILGGHISVDFKGKDCSCGNRGCAESLASTWALARNLEAKYLGDFRNIQALVSGSQQNDPQAIAILEQFIAVWGTTIVSLCHLFDPETVIVSGGPMKSAEHILPTLSKTVASRLWSSLVPPKILVPEDPEMSVFRGLAQLGLLSIRRGYRK